MSTHHRQARVQLGRKWAQVDEAMAPLVRELWRAGIDTFSSCQNAGASTIGAVEEHPHLAAKAMMDDGVAYVDLYDEASVVTLYDLIAGFGASAEMRDQRMNHWVYEGAWSVHCCVRDLRLDNGFGAICYQVRFPASDIPEMVECLKRANDLMARTG